MTKAVIEIGSNSIKFLVIKGEKVLTEKVIVTKFLNSLESGNVIFNSPFFKKTISVVKNFKTEAEKLKVAEIFLIGTHALRKIKDLTDIKAFFLKEVGLNLIVLSEKEEAYLGYQIIKRSLKLDNFLLLDVGGGSSELSFFSSKYNEMILTSLPLGAIELTQKYKMAIPFFKKIDFIQKEVKKEIEEFLEENKIKPDSRFSLIGIGGAITLMLKLLKKEKSFKNLSNNCEGETIFKKEILSLLIKLSKLDTKLRIKKWSIPSERADILPAGMMIILSFMEVFKKQVIKVSFYGIRHFILIDGLEKELLRKKVK